VTRVLFVVDRGQPILYEHLVRALVGTGIEALVDRRRHQRRQVSRPHGPERRRQDRRRRPDDPARFYPLGYVIERVPAPRRWLARLTAIR
jgi:hypothetical protein